MINSSQDIKLAGYYFNQHVMLVILTEFVAEIITVRVNSNRINVVNSIKCENYLYIST